MYTLAIVDMQWYFGASHKASVIAACKREIRQAMKARAAILFIEYANCRSTISTLKKIVRDARYNRAATIIKNDDDGSPEVITAIEHNKFPRTLRVCGVNTDACVQATVEGLASDLRRAKIKIIADACNTESGKDGHEEALSSMVKFQNVKIVRRVRK